MEIRELSRLGGILYLLLLVDLVKIEERRPLQITLDDLIAVSHIGLKHTFGVRVLIRIAFIFVIRSTLKQLTVLRLVQFVILSAAAAPHELLLECIQAVFDRIRVIFLHVKFSYLVHRLVVLVIFSESGLIDVLLVGDHQRFLTVKTIRDLAIRLLIVLLVVFVLVVVDVVFVIVFRLLDVYYFLLLL